MNIVISAQLTAEATAQGIELDYAVLHEQITARRAELTTIAMIISDILTLFIYWLDFLSRKKKFFTEISLRTMDAKGILPVFLLGVFVNLAITLFLRVVPFPQGWVDSYHASNVELSEGSIFVGWVATVLIAPVVEETVFRGLVYTRLKKGMPALAAAIIVSLLFGVLHGTAIWFCYSFVTGLLFVWCYEKFRSLTASILLHMPFDLAGQALSMVPEVPDAAVWVMGIAAVIVTVGMILLIRRKCAAQTEEQNAVSV